MNRRPPGLEISKAIQGFVQFKQAEGLSPRTIESYTRDLKMWLDFQGDHPTSKITPQDLRKYLTYMATEYTPRRLVGNNEIKLAPKTIRNIFITLCAFFHWASDEFEIPNPMKSVPAPKFQEPPIQPFSKEEIESMLKA